VVPDNRVLESGYRRALQVHIVNSQMKEICEVAQREAEEAKLPRSLRNKVLKRLRENPSLSWDDATSQLAREEGKPNGR
jgi:hypothetical protein